MTGLMLHVIEQLITGGAMVERGGTWMLADGTGRRVQGRTMEALARRGLVSIGVTGLGRTAAISPRGALMRSLKRERLMRDRKGNRTWVKLPSAPARDRLPPAV